MIDFDKLAKSVGGLPKLAALAGRSRTAVYHWRKSRDMRVSDLLRICDAAGLDAREFLLAEETATNDELD